MKKLLIYAALLSLYGGIVMPSAQQTDEESMIKK